MRASLIFCLTLAAVALTQEAQEASGNPMGVTYQAILPDSNDTNIRGYLAVTTANNATGANVNLNFYGFGLNGPYLYSIDEQSVGDNGDCSSSTTFNPYNADNTTACSSSDIAKCRVGDLSGVNGEINSTPWQKNFYDPYLSTKPETKAFVGDKSFSIYYKSNGTRITCSDFKLVAGNPTATGSAAPSGVSETAPPSATSDAAAPGAAVGAGAAMLGLMALLL